MNHVFTFTVTHKFPSLNEAIAAAKKHWAVYAKMKKENTSLVAEYVRSLRGSSDFPLGVFNQVSLRLMFQERARGRLRDWDNITFAKKFILDGLVVAGVIPDDSPKHITDIHETVFYGDEYSVMVSIGV